MGIYSDALLSSLLSLVTREQEEEEAAPLSPNYGMILYTLVLAPGPATGTIQPG